jgi:TonB family protein
MLGIQPVRFLLIAVFATVASAQTIPMHLGPGITPPRLKKKVEPEFSPLARKARIQGTVLLQIVVTERGRASNIEVISPLGFGLDEKAEQAILKWEFIPAEKDGMPIPVLATVEVNFRLADMGFNNQGYEERRTKFNVALKSLQHNGSKTMEDSIKTMLALAKENFPPALYLVGEWEVEGINDQPKDASGGLAKIQKAAEMNYGPAIYEIALQTINDSSQQKGTWEKIRLAATLGSQSAQYLLGDHYQRGVVVEQNAERAKSYFRLCAAWGNTACQLRLARLMFDAPNRRDYEYEQALAWFQLAGERGMSEATQIVEHETPNLTASQEKRIETLKRQFTGHLN